MVWKEVNTATKIIQRVWRKKRTIKILVNIINKYFYEINPQHKSCKVPLINAFYPQKLEDTPKAWEKFRERFVLHIGRERMHLPHIAPAT